MVEPERICHMRNSGLKFQKSGMSASVNSSLTNDLFIYFYFYSFFAPFSFIFPYT